jgi:hypothetical protein
MCVALADIPSGAVAVYWDFGRASIGYRASKNRNKRIIDESTSANASGGGVGERRDRNR